MPETKAHYVLIGIGAFVGGDMTTTLSSMEVEGTALAARDPSEIRRMKVMHVITALGIGGAQSMLLKLLEQGERALPKGGQSVLSLKPPLVWGDQIEATGAALHSLQMHFTLPTPAAMARLISISREVAPDLLLGWMHHGGLAAWYAAKAHSPRLPVIWNVRHSLSDIRHEKVATRLILRYCAGLSRDVDAIIFNSRVASEQYRALGYHQERATIIPNGFDCERFRPRPGARAELYSLFGIDPSRRVLGMVARYHPMKSPETLIEAVRRLRADGHDVHLLIVGPGMDDPNGPVVRTMAGSLPPDRYTLVGQRLDIAEWLSGLDLLILPSAWGEAFANILGEAMASGVPCVATDVGDAGWIVGETGRIVPPRDPEAMAVAIARMLASSAEARRALGDAARTRVRTCFSIERIAEDYAALYESVIESWRRRTGKAG